MIKKRMCAWVWVVLFSCAMFPQRQRMDLQGKWAFKLDVRGNGEESGFATAPFAEEVMLPGTTDTNRKGFRPARTDETTYLTRLHASCNSLPMLHNTTLGWLRSRTSMFFRSSCHHASKYCA